jgi:hypothetical protein
LGVFDWAAGLLDIGLVVGGCGSLEQGFRDDDDAVCLFRFVGIWGRLRFVDDGEFTFADIASEVEGFTFDESEAVFAGNESDLEFAEHEECDAEVEEGDATAFFEEQITSEEEYE